MKDAERGSWVADVQDVLQQLILRCILVLGQLLLTHALLYVSRRDALGLLSVQIELVQTGDNIAAQSSEPELGRRLTDLLVILERDELCSVCLHLSSAPFAATTLEMCPEEEKRMPSYPICGIIRQVPGISELSSDGEILDDRVCLCLALRQDGCCLRVLDWLPQAHQLTRQSEVRLQRCPWRNHIGSRTLAQEVPGIEARPILHSTVDLVTADGGGSELQKVGDEGRVCLLKVNHYPQSSRESRRTRVSMFDAAFRRSTRASYKCQATHSPSCPHCLFGLKWIKWRHESARAVYPRYKHTVSPKRLQNSLRNRTKTSDLQNLSMAISTVCNI